MDGVGEPHERRVRRYAARVTVATILVCTMVLLVGIYGSGVKVSGLIRLPERFNPLQDICVRLAWVKVRGEQERVRLCSEWIQLSDPSGETHTFQQETEVVKTADGKLYFDDGQLVDHRLFMLAAFVLVVAVAGLLSRRYLVARYRLRLGASETLAGNHSSS